MNYAGKFGSGTPDHFSSAGLKIDALGHQSGVDSVTIPDAHLLFSGDYSRSGADLIVSDQMHRVVVPNYFHSDTRPVLLSPDGAPLDLHVIEALTGHVQYAQAAGTAAAAAAKVVGHVVKMTGSASVVRNGVTITLNNGDTVLQNDVVQTGSSSSVGLVMIDGTTFNLSAGARLMLNDLTYDASSTSNSSLFTLVQGAASFVAGQVAKTGDMKVGTPVATMGIRGTAVVLDISAVDGKVSISVIDQRDGLVHSVQVFNSRGVLIGTVTSNGSSLTLTPIANFEVIAQESNKTAAQVQQEFNIFREALTLYEIQKAIDPNLPQHTENNNANPRQYASLGSTSADSPQTVFQAPTGSGAPGSAPGGGTVVQIDFTPPPGGPGPSGSSSPQADPIPLQVVVQSAQLPFVVNPSTVPQISTAPGNHFGPVMSASGNVVYDPDGVIYFYDRETNTTIRVTPENDGFAYSGQTISSDGRYLVYQGTNGADTFVYVYGTDPSDAAHYHQQLQLVAGGSPAISGDGSTILVEHGGSSIGIYNLQGDLQGTITAAAAGATGTVWRPSISADGHVMAFWTSDGATAGGAGHLFTYDVTTGTVTDIASTATDAGTSAASFSADGRYVTYQSDAPGGHSEIYLYDLSTGQVIFHTANVAGASYNPVISPDGHFIVFASDAHLTSGDTNAFTDIYTVDLTNPHAPVYKLISVRPDGTPGDADSNLGAAISAGGKFVVFGTRASNFSNDPDGGDGDIFISDPSSGRNTIINETANSPSILHAQGVIGLTGDRSGTLGISVSDNSGRFTAGFDANGNIVWNFNEARSDFNSLAYGQDSSQQFVITLTAGGNTTTIPVNVTVHNGVQPVITVVDAAPGAAPVALAQGTEDTSYTITAAALLAGVGDIDTPLSLLSITDVSIRSGGGELDHNENGNWTYMPAADFDGPVVFNYTVSDGNKTASSTASLTIASVNDAPKFTGHGPAEYVAGGPAVVVASGVFASDVDSDNYDGGWFRATVTAGGNEGDTLSIVNNAFISIASGNVVMFDADGDGDTSNAVAIGDLASNYGNVNSVTVNLNHNANDAAVQALAQAVRFENGKQGAVPGNRTVTFTLNDGGGTANGGHDSDFFEATVDVASQAAATTLTFDDLPGTESSIPNGYGGFTWSNFYYLNASNYAPVSGYAHGTVSGPNVALNGFGMTASVSGATFNFIGAYLTGAWNDGLSVTVVAYDHSVLVDQQTVVVDSDAPTWFEFDFMGITDLVFSSSGGSNGGYNGLGQHFALDNFTFSMSVNHAATFGGQFGGSVVEDTSTTTSGSLTVQDLDAGQSYFLPVNLDALDGIYGHFNFNAGSGHWNYTLNHEYADSLRGGHVVHDTLTVRSADGTQQVIDITITGTNDAALIGGDITGEVTEDDRYTDASGNVVAHDVDGGTLTVQDVDGGESHFLPIAPDAAELVGTYGNFTFDAGTGEWTYALVHAWVDALAAGEVRTDTLTVKSADGTTQDITVTVHGVNDAPVLADHENLSFSPIDASDENNAGQTVASLLGSDVSDVDGPGSGIAIVGSTVDGTYGHWEYRLDGSEGWTAFDATDSQALLLGAEDYVRFAPTLGYSGQPSIVFRAWDGSSGTAGNTANVKFIGTGGSTPFSAHSNTADIVVTDTPPRPNQAPVIDLNGEGEGVNAEIWLGPGSAAYHIFNGVTISDTDFVDSIHGMTVTWIGRLGDSMGFGNGGSPSITVEFVNTENGGSIVYSGAASASEYVAALESTTLQSWHTESPTFTVTVNDGTIDGEAATIQVFFEPQPDWDVWTRAGGGNWNDSGNWSLGRAPLPAEHVFIAAGSDQHVLLSLDGDDNKVAELHLEPDNFLSIVGNGQHTDFTVTGALINNGGTLELTSAHFELLNPSPGGSRNVGQLVAGVDSTLELHGTIHNYGNLWADGTTAQVVLNGATIIGGMLQAFNGGHIEIASGATSVLDGSDGSGFTNPVTTSGTILVSDAATLELRGRINHENGAITNNGTIDVSAGAQGAIWQIFGGSFTNHGLVVSNATGGLQIVGYVINEGTLEARLGTLTVGDVTGNNSHALIDGGTLEFSGASNAAVRFSGSSSDRLILDDPGHFTGTISGLSYGDSIHLSYSPTSITYVVNVSTGLLEVHYGDGSDFILVDAQAAQLYAYSDSNGGANLMLIDEAPLISTDNLQITSSGDTTTIGGLTVSDPDATLNETFTLTGAAVSGSIVRPLTPYEGALDDINFALNTGVTYDPGSSPSSTDMVTLTVADRLGVTDTVNFIFHQAGEGPVNLQGTSGKDVIFATGYVDTLTGGAGADQFVFTANTGHDTITDFTPGQDRIDLFDYLPFVSGSAASFNAWISNDDAVEQLASGTLIHLDAGDSILLSNVSRSSLHMNDFILHPGGGGSGSV